MSCKEVPGRGQGSCRCLVTPCDTTSPLWCSWGHTHSHVCMHTPCPPRSTWVPGIGQSKSVAHFYSKKIFLLELLVFSAGFNTHCFYFQRSRCHALLFSPHYRLGKCRAKACVNQVSFLNTAPCSLPIKPVSCWVVYTPRLALPRWEIAF